MLFYGQIRIVAENWHTKFEFEFEFGLEFEFQFWLELELELELEFGFEFEFEFEFRFEFEFAFELDWLLIKSWGVDDQCLSDHCLTVKAWMISACWVIV